MKTRAPKMNERIKQLAIQTVGDYSKGDYWPFFEEELEMFAELIVQECAEITDGLSKLYPRTDVAFDVGYTMGTTRATKEIQEHFGVKE